MRRTHAPEESRGRTTRVLSHFEIEDGVTIACEVVLVKETVIVAYLQAAARRSQLDRRGTRVSLEVAAIEWRHHDGVQILDGAGERLVHRRLELWSVVCAHPLLNHALLPLAIAGPVHRDSRIDWRALSHLPPTVTR